MSHPQPFTIDQIKADLEKMTANKSSLTYRLWNDESRIDVHTNTDMYGFPSVALLKHTFGHGLDVFHLNTLDMEDIRERTATECATDPHYEVMIKWITDTLNTQIVSVMPEGHPMYPQVFYSSITTEFAVHQIIASSHHVTYESK